MDYQISKLLAEEFASTIEDAKSFGLEWVTFNVTDNRIVDRTWSAHRYRLDAYEHAAIEGPGIRVAEIKTMLPELYQVIDQPIDKLKQDEIFDDLKHQLADGGFNDPGLVEELRQFMAMGGIPEHLTFSQKYGDETYNLYIAIEHDTGHKLKLAVYDLDITVNGNASKLRMQYFKPEVPFAQALKLLTERSNYPELDDIVVLAPMSARQVSEELAKLSLPVPIKQIAGPLSEQLNALGFETLVPALEKKVSERQQRFFLSTEQMGEGGKFTYNLNFRPDDEGTLTFDHYRGYIIPHDPVVMEHILLGLDDLDRARNFEADVPLSLANEVLQNLLPLNKANEQLTPLTAEAAREFLTLKTNEMNTENLSYLQKQLLNLGFGEKLNDELEKNLKAGKKEFSIKTDLEYNKQLVDYTLNFKLGDDRVFFNNYDASLRDKDMQQTFYVNKYGAITAKEAYNLLEGRAVHKELETLEGEKYKAWIIIDKENKTEKGNYKLRPFTEGWNYKPERAIDKMDIVGINEEGAREKLMKSLEKGNRHQVTAMKDGKEVKLFIEANPAEHRVNLTNWKGEAQQLEHYKKPEFKNEQKKDHKQAQGQEDAPAKKSRKTNKMKV